MSSELLTRDAIGTMRFAGATAPLGADEYAAIVATEAVAMDQNAWMIDGMDLAYIRSFPSVTRDHEANRIVGAVSRLGIMSISGQKAVGATIRRLPQGVSADADETWRLVDAGALRGVSAGIYPIAAEPIDRNRPGRGVRVTRSRLVDISVVARPSDANARLLLDQQRSMVAHAGMFRRLARVPASQAILARVGKVLSSVNHEHLSGICGRMEGECAKMRSWLDSLDADADWDGDEDEDANQKRARRQREADALRLRVPADERVDELAAARRRREAEALRLRWPRDEDPGVEQRRREAARLGIGP
jgi:hypothetical protein